MAKFTGHTITSDSALGSAVIQRSLRFNRADSAHLTYTPASASSDRTKVTISAWVKKCGINEGEYSIFHGGTASSDRSQLRFYTSSGYDNISWAARVGGSWILELYTSQKFRDPTAWYHIVARCDTTNGTSNIYINGVEVTSFTTSTKPSGSQSLTFFNNVEHQIGERGYSGSGTYMNGYMAEMNVIQGQALDASYFGFTDSQTGIWLPKRYEGTYGDGFYLDFSDNTSTTTLGIDKSPNGNDFTANNFSVSAGAGNDSLEDTPTNNFCTLNALQKDSNTTLSEGNLKAAGSSSTDYSTNTRGTFAQSSGKWYYEAVCDSTGVSNGLSMVGWVKTSIRFSDNPTGGSGVGYRPNKGDYVDFTVDNTTGKPTTSTGTVIQIAIDFDAGKIWFGSGGTYFESGDPSAGLNAARTFTAGTEMAPVVRTLSATYTFNFGQRPFSYTVPTGFKTLKSRNLLLTVPSIVRPQKHFDTLLWTGANTVNSRNITGLEFKPDWVWIKARNRSSYGGGLNYHHMIWDSVRGVGSTSSSSGKDLAINQTIAESSSTTYSNLYGHISSFNDGGFTVQKESGEPAIYTDYGSTDYVAWCWKAGGAAVTNNDGSIASQVSANQQAGFSICTWTGTGSNLSFGHGLGKKPDWVITKARTGSSGCDWYVYHKEIGATHNLRLNGTSTSGASSDLFNNTEPTSSVFSIGNSSCINENGGTYLSYCWTEIPGFSKFGSYTGNASTGGTYVHCGFRPAFVLCKMYDGINENWTISDSTRSTHNPVDLFLRPDETTSDTSGAATMDFLSNGFKLRNTDDKTNRNGGKYIFAAFAEEPGTTPFDTVTNAR